MERPMDVLVDYNVIVKKIKNKGIIKYIFYKPLDYYSIKIDKK